MTTSSPSDDHERFALRAGRLFDGERWLERPVVLVQDGRIMADGASVEAGVDSVGVWRSGRRVGHC